MEQLLTSFVELLTPVPLFFIALGTMLGVVIGAIPGLGPAMLIALLLPLTFYMDSVNALIMLVSIYVGGISGGLISAALLKMPGTPAAIMTTMDAYPMAMSGQASRALSLGVIASFAGGMISWVFLAALSPSLAEFALRFGPYEFLALVLMALILISAVSQGALLKGLIGALFGFGVAIVGPDVASGVIRLNFGYDELNAGFRLLPTLLGLFVVSQLIEMLIGDQKPVQQASTTAMDILRNTGNMVKHWGNVIRSSVIGTWIGILPGVGSAVAAIVSYSVTRNVSKKKEEFGRGSEEGIVAAESANNAAVNGALVPLIALGIPGSVVDAILIGALIVHDLQPGPGLFREQPQVAYGIVAAALIANIIMFAFMITCAGTIAKVARIPKSLLVPTILVFCIIGVFTATNRFFDVWIMLGFGVIGYLLRRAGVPIGTVVLGFILAPIAESELRNGLMLYNGSLWPIVTRPIALAFVIASIVMLAWPLISKRLATRREALDEGTPKNTTRPNT